MNEIKQIQQLINHKNWQKFCTGEDWSDPAFKYVLNEVFNKNASYHRKQWEFVVIFLCLVQQGKLGKNAKGASFGAGKEPLIYDLLPYVDSFLATDLYSWSTGWDTARLGEKDTPMDFLQRHAPKNLNINNLSACEMDMRKLEGIKDASLDFCYSSCAIEHIGHREDFIAHLHEVKRVLKDDGVYVVTTELLFNHDTVKTKGNYKFDLNFLREIFIEAGLDTLTEFDATMQQNRLNVPRAYLQPLHAGSNLLKVLPTAALLDIEGVAYTSCCFVLSPKKQPQATTFQTRGFTETAKFVGNKVVTTMLSVFSHKQLLDPFYSLKKQNRRYLDDHMQFRSNAENTKPLIKFDQPNFCYTNFIWFADNAVDFEIDFQLENYNGKIKWLIIEKSQLQMKPRHKILTKTTAAKLGKISINFKAEPHKTYALIGQFPPKLLNKEFQFSIQRLNVFARIVSNETDG